jgi:hypothetical protein
VSSDYLANLRKLEKRFAGWARVMKRGGTQNEKPNQGVRERKNVGLCCLMEQEMPH